MNRRSILRLFGFGAAAAVVPMAAVEDLIPSIGTPELIPWVAPAGNTILTVHEITKEALKVWNHSNNLLEFITRSPELDESLFKVGDTIRIHTPVEFKVRA